jgi:hypothetical protein
MTSAIEKFAFFAPIEEVLEEKADPLVTLGREAPSRFLVITNHESDTLPRG